MATKSAKRKAARAAKFGHQQPCENGVSKSLQRETETALPDAEKARVDVGLSSDLLRDPMRTKEDLELTEMMVQGVWQQGARTRKQILERLHEIAQKRTATVFTKFGPVESEIQADELAVKAMRLAILIEQQDQKDRHQSQAMNKPETQINIDNRRVIILPRNGRESKALEQAD
jgi:hypothetical protein